MPNGRQNLELYFNQFISLNDWAANSFNYKMKSLWNFFFKNLMHFMPNSVFETLQHFTKFTDIKDLFQRKHVKTN